MAGHAADAPDRVQPSAVAASVVEVAKAQQIQQQTLQALEDRVKSQEAALLEGGRKHVDWWLSLIGFLVGFIALFGVVFPIFSFQAAREKIQQDIKHVESIKNEVNSLESHARGVVKVIDGYRDKLVEIPVGGLPGNRDPVLNSGDAGGDYEGVGPVSYLYQKASYFSGDPDRSRAVANSVLADKAAPVEENLLARAVLASLIDNPNPEQLLQAYELWEALTELSAADGFAHANAGERASSLSEAKVPAREGRTWLDLAVRHYGQAFQYGVSQPWGIASNLGNCIASKANECVHSNEELGFELIEQAEAKYRLAIALKPDYEVAQWNSHVAASNFALAVLKAFGTKEQLKDPSTLNVDALQRAVRLLQRYKATGHDVVAFNLACLYAVLGDAQRAVDEFDHWFLTDEKKRRPDHPLFPVFGISRISDSEVFKAWKAKRYPPNK